MDFKFNNKKVSGVLTVVPKNTVKFLDEIDNYGFSKEKCLNLQEVMGFNERRIVKGDECGSDLALYGMEYLIEKGLLNKEDIGALILITQTPDHFMPPTSSILHGKLGLGKQVLCFDINQGCTGYVYGLLQAFLLLESSCNGKIVLINCDTLSRRACQYDRNIFPIIGDAGAITIIENSEEENEISLNLNTDGSRSDWLKIPAGGFRKPSNDETREIKELADGNRRSEDDFYMNGAGIFTFTQTDVPRSIKQFFETSSIGIDHVDYFMFHQPNRFMLGKLAKKLNVSPDKMPSNVVEKFGNSSSASTPLVICYNLDKKLIKNRFKICIAGFGVGLSWGVTTLEMGPLDFCEWIEK